LLEKISEKAREQIQFSLVRIERSLGFKFFDPHFAKNLFAQKFRDASNSTRVREIFTSLQIIFENLPENGDQNLRRETRKKLELILFRLVNDPLDHDILKILEKDARKIFGEVRENLRKSGVNFEKNRS
jgi:hypothetical protein